MNDSKDIVLTRDEDGKIFLWKFVPIECLHKHYGSWTETSNGYGSLDDLEDEIKDENGINDLLEIPTPITDEQLDFFDIVVGLGKKMQINYELEK